MHTMKRVNQFYYEYDEDDEVSEVVIPKYSSQFLNTTEDPVERLARMEKQLDLKEKEELLELRRMKLERDEKKKGQISKATRSAHLLDLMDQMEQEGNSKQGFQ